MPEVIISHLEMHSPDALKTKPQPAGLDVIEARVKEFRFNRFLYQLVGDAWSWTDRLVWPDAQWQAYAESDRVRTWVAYNQGAVAGYYELHQQKPGNVEIAYFGLSPKFIGRGFGGYLLSHATLSAWSLQGTQRVFVQTCTLDHPSALNNYNARGFQVYQTETINRAI